MAEHHVYFAVFGFTEAPEAISALAGTEADEVWRRGEAYSELMPDARRTENRWIISSGLDEHASHSEHFRALLARLAALRETLPRLQQRYRCGIGVSHYYFMDEPTFYLPAELRAGFRQLGLPISFNQLALDHDAPGQDGPAYTGA